MKVGGSWQGTDVAPECSQTGDIVESTAVQYDVSTLCNSACLVRSSTENAFWQRQILVGKTYTYEGLLSFKYDDWSSDVSWSSKKQINDLPSLQRLVTADWLPTVRLISS